jgi:isopenicillin-N epimerase
MAANRELALAGRRVLNERLGLEPVAPESMVGAMATVRLPVVLDEEGANEIVHSLAADERIEVPISVFPVRAAREPGAGPTANLLRISAQRYNEPSDYERLADALVRRGLARTAAGTGSGIVAG